MIVEDDESYISGMIVGLASNSDLHGVLQKYEFESFFDDKDLCIKGNNILTVSFDKGLCPMFGKGNQTLELIEQCKKLSDVLQKEEIQHRFEVTDENDEIAGYFHYELPQ